MFKFANPEYLYLLVLVPVLVALHVFSNISRRRKLQEYGDRELLSRLMPDASVGRPNIKFWLLFAAYTLCCFLLARPQFGSRQETVTRRGIETVIALDISNSMLADDVAPNRLEKSKRIISNLVDQFKDDKVGLIVFAGDAFVQLPITSDFISAKVFLNAISPALINRQGTDIRAAIELATRSFTPSEGVGKAIIVITDGENHEGGAVEAAQAAAEKGYMVYVKAMWWLHVWMRRCAVTSLLQVRVRISMWITPMLPRKLCRRRLTNWPRPMSKPPFIQNMMNSLQ